MTLVELSTVSSSLICPRCGSALIGHRGGFRCSSPPCTNGSGEEFPRIERWPVLVDFDSSILDYSQLASAPRARTAAHRWALDRLPAVLRSLWKPPNRVADRNARLLLSLLGERSPLALVIGGGTIGNGLDALYEGRARILAFDIYASPSTQFIADAHRIPLASGSVDAVVVPAVLEHVLDPARVVAEIHRVLRPGGLVYAETPFLQPVHAGPYDFTRFTSSGHRYLFRSFDEIAAGPVAGPGTQMLWSVDHLVRALFRSELAGKLARALFFWLRWLDRLVPREFAMDDAAAYYFLGRRAEREATPSEIVGYYQGAQRSHHNRRVGTVTSIRDVS
jgi:SAM-dependent methyltransferase